VSRAPMLTSRALLAAAVAGGRLYALGGTPGGGFVLNTNEEYTP
jgi:hypothetical protein